MGQPVTLGFQLMMLGLLVCAIIGGFTWMVVAA